MHRSFSGTKYLLIAILLAISAPTGPLVAQSAEPRFTPFNCKQLAPAPAQPNALRVMFLGVSTVLFDDGATQFMTDAFFSRPDMVAVGFGKIAPNLVQISSALQRAAALGPDRSARRPHAIG